MLATWRDLQQEWRDRPPLEVRLSDYDALLTGPEEAPEEAPEAAAQDQEVAP
jgi:hypothetical protein